MPTIIDTHTHLYEYSDASEVLRQSFAANVSDVIALGVDLASNRKHLEIAQMAPQDKQTRLHIALGLHPGNIAEGEEAACFTFFREVLTQKTVPVIAIGETGLDYSYKWVRDDEAKKREQRDIFEKHLALAKEFNLPIVVHSRGAWRDCLSMVKASGVSKVDFHWYCGPLDVLGEILDNGYMISCPPALEYSPELRRAMEAAPLDRILVETDTPVRGWSPKDVWKSLRLLANLKNTSEEETLQIVNRNAQALFGDDCRGDS
jgi:TatD DNase family protein